MEQLPFELLVNNASVIDSKFTLPSVEIYNALFTNNTNNNNNNNEHVVIRYNSYFKYIDYILSLRSYTLSTQLSQLSPLNIDNSFHSIALSLLLTLLNDAHTTTTKVNHFNKLLSFCFSLSTNNVISFPCIHSIYRTLLSTTLEHVLTLHMQRKALHFTHLKTLIEALTLNSTTNSVYDPSFINDVINLLQSKLFTQFNLKLQLHRYHFFMSFLNIHTTNNNTQQLIFTFLCEIYKFNVKGNLYHTVLYAYSHTSNVYLMNTLIFLSKLIKCETTLRSSANVFRRGFILSHNNSLIHSGITFTKRVDSYMFVFGFNLMSTNDKSKQVKILSMRHKVKDKEKVLIEMFTEGENGRLHLTHNETQTYSIKYYINRNNNYIFVLDVNRSKRCKIWCIKSSEGEEYLIEELTKFNVMFTTNDEMILELGGANFNGVFSDVMIIKTESESFFTKAKPNALTVKDITALKDEYYRLCDNILSYKLVNEIGYTFHKRVIDYVNIVQRFRDSPNDCVYHLSVESLGSTATTNITANTPVHLYRSVEDTSIEMFDYRATCFEFLHNDGVDFLIFALHVIESAATTAVTGVNTITAGEFVLNVLKLVQNMIEVVGVDVLLCYETNMKVFFYELVRFMRKMNVTFNDEIMETLCFVVNVVISSDDDVDVRGKEVGQMLMENCFCVSCLAENISNDSVDQMLSIMNTSVKRYPRCFQNEQILQQILSFDYVLDTGTPKQNTLYRSLLLSCLKNNNDVLNRFLQFVMNNTESNEMKMCFYIKVIYVHCISKDVSTQIMHVPQLDKFYKEFVRKSIDTVCPGHCRECDLTFCYLFLIIKHYIHYNNNNNCCCCSNNNNDDDAFAQPLIKLIETKSVFVSPTLTFIKAVIVSTLHNCNNTNKSAFIENTKTHNDKTYFNDLDLRNQFLTSSHTVDKRRCLGNAVNDILSYLEFVINNQSDNYITTTGNNAVYVYRDFLISALDDTASLDESKSFYVNDVFVTAFPRFFGFYCKHQPQTAIPFMESVIERCLTCITVETFYKSMLDVSQLVSMNTLCEVMNVLLDAAAKVCNDNREEANRTEVLTSLYVLKSVYAITTSVEDSSTLLTAVETKVMLFLVSIKSLTISKHWFSINGVDGCKTVCEMAFDLYMMLYRQERSNKTRYQMLLKKLLMCDTMGDGVDEDETVFYRMEREVVEWKALLIKPRNKKTALNETQFTTVQDYQRQKEKIKFLNEVSDECGYCMVVYFLGKLMHIAAENAGDEKVKFVEEMVMMFMKDALKAKGVNRKFTENFVVNDKKDKGVLKRTYVMLMKYFKDKADVDVNEEDVKRYYKEVVKAKVKEDEEEHYDGSKYVRTKGKKATVMGISKNITVNIGGLQLFDRGDTKVNEVDEMVVHNSKHRHTIRKERAMSLQCVHSRLGRLFKEEEMLYGYVMLYSNEVGKDDEQLQRGTTSNNNNNHNHNIERNSRCNSRDDLDNNNNNNRHSSNRNRVISELQRKYSLQAEADENGVNTYDNNTNTTNIGETTTPNIPPTNTNTNIPPPPQQHKQEPLMKYFTLLFKNPDKPTTSLLFNPRNYFIWRTFSYLLHNHLFHNQTFLQLTYRYNLIFHSKFDPSTITYTYALPYPTKLKNFTTPEYTKPFIKPDLNFFTRSSYPITHGYFPTPNPNANPLHHLLSSFTSVVPEVSAPKSTYQCELVNNQGYYYGVLEMNEHVMLFRSTLNEEEHMKSETNVERKMEFVFASQDLDRIKTRNKNVLIYLDEIEEVIQRRFALLWIGFEVFLKDKRSYLFNFYTQEKYAHFAEEINNVQYKRRLNMLVVTDSKSQFKKFNYKYKYAKDKAISSYQYLLYMNKYTGRSYNDVFQYPVMPWMVVNLFTKAKRFLGKVMGLQKMHRIEMLLSGGGGDGGTSAATNEDNVDSAVNDDSNSNTNNNNNNNNNACTPSSSSTPTYSVNAVGETYIEDDKNTLGVRLEEMRYKLETNIESLGYHFNLHYSTNGALYFYLSRIYPFTQALIKFQSGTFDAPSRMFFSVSELLHMFETSEENRELIPEFYYNYHFLINLNNNDLGYFREKHFQIGNVICDTYTNPIHFIVHQRELLDASTKVPEWIDLIFGINQHNKAIYNSFAPESYAALNNYITRIKEMRAEGMNDDDVFKVVRESLTLLSLGVTPHRLFKKVHPTYANFVINANAPKHDVKDIIDYTKLHKCVNDCVNTTNNGLYDVKYVDMNFIIKSHGKLNLFELDAKGKKVHLKEEFIFDDHVHFEPEQCAYCEVSQYAKVYAFVRYNDNTLKLFAKQKKNVFYLKSYKWPCFISAVARKRNGVVFIADEYGYITELEMVVEGKDATKVSAWCNQKVHCHNTLIRGMLYDERLSVVVSFDVDGVVCLNNAHSLCLMCVIEPEVKLIEKGGVVVDVKVNKKDFVYVVYTNGVVVYTLCGMKVSEYVSRSNVKGVEVDYDENVVVNEGKVVKKVCMWDMQTILNEEVFDDCEVVKVFVLRGVKTKWYVRANGEVVERGCE